jgi:hypothetical protein
MERLLFAKCCRILADGISRALHSGFIRLPLSVEWRTGAIELNDGYLRAPPDMDLVTETTCHRAFCGEGQFDVRGFVDTLRKICDGPWGETVPARHSGIAVSSTR